MAKTADGGGGNGRQPVLHRDRRRCRDAPAGLRAARQGDRGARRRRSGSATSATRAPGSDPAHRDREGDRRRPLIAIAAIVLAAGASTRYGGVKQHELLPAVLAALRETSVDEVVVVEGAHALSVPDVRVVRVRRLGARPGRVASLRPRRARRRRRPRGDRPRRRPGARPARRRPPRRAPGAVRGRVVRRDARPPGRARAERIRGDVPDEGLRDARQPVLVDCSDLGCARRRRRALRRPSSGVRNAASFAFSSGDIGSLTATRT